jgi:hypothetical protein
MKSNKLLIGGDMNFSIDRGEFCGSTAHEDPLLGFFVDNFDRMGWVDFDPIEPAPTWSNNSSSFNFIGECLD